MEISPFSINHVSLNGPGGFQLTVKLPKGSKRMISSYLYILYISLLTSSYIPISSHSIPILISVVSDTSCITRLIVGCTSTFLTQQLFLLTSMWICPLMWICLTIGTPPHGIPWYTWPFAIFWLRNCTSSWFKLEGYPGTLFLDKPMYHKYLGVLQIRITSLELNSG